MRLFNCVMDIGEQMLLSGAEVHRAEESISRMCYALGADRVDVFIITSSMVVTVHTKDGDTYTQTRRVMSAQPNFEKLHLLNNLSREICAKKLTQQDIEKKLKAINDSKKPPVWLEILSYAVIAGSFALFFGGNITEALIALVVGVLARVSLLLSEKISTNKIFSKFIATIVITACAFSAVRLGLVGSEDKVIIGNIMSIIPGIGLTNALRDLFAGDSIAGMLRSIEAALTALAIAAGYFLVVILGGLL